MNDTGRSTGNGAFRPSPMGPVGQRSTESLIDALAFLENGDEESIRKAKVCIRSAVNNVQILGKYEERPPVFLNFVQRREVGPVKLPMDSKQIANDLGRRMEN
ncbi:MULTISPECIES: hypothetical protein [unclassified Maridesulfovibrio]|uniref:hypothetical protein n=1 Tax=unclassified Maridesulfovibrio TaxID=2794999 RepID=UPI003B3F0B61